MSKEQELFEAYADHVFKKEYADRLQSKHGKHKSMAEIRSLVDYAATSLRHDFGPDDYDELLRYAAFVDVFRREAEDNLQELTDTLIRHNRILELLESDQSNSALKDEIVAHLQDTPIIGRAIDAGKRHVKRQRAQTGAAAKHATDPKQEAKAGCRKEWDAWQSGEQVFTGKESFARYCLEEYPVLTSSKVITGWCREWEKEAQNQG
ncbi:MAG: hypothetical protein ACOYBR_08030 [Fluviibacter sp.]